MEDVLLHSVLCPRYFVVVQDSGIVEPSVVNEARILHQANVEQVEHMSESRKWLIQEAQTLAGSSSVERNPAPSRLHASLLLACGRHLLALASPSPPLSLLYCVLLLASLPRLLHISLYHGVPEPLPLLPLPLDSRAPCPDETRHTPTIPTPNRHHHLYDTPYSARLALGPRVVV